MQATGTRATQLNNIAKTLHDTPTAEREVLQQAMSKVRNYNSEQGTETFCKIFSWMSNKTHIKSIDENNTLWQLNWVEIAWPEGNADDLCTKDGSRLFPSIDARDGTGLGPRMRMNEESVLALAQASSKEEFLELHAAGKHNFPAMATVKVLREVQKPKDSESGGAHSAQEDREYINFTIASAADQPLKEKPTQATLQRIPLMPQVEHDSACILP